MELKLTGKLRNVNLLGYWWSLPVPTGPKLADPAQTQNVETPINIGSREQVGPCANALPVSAKPLFIGSIPIAASNESFT